MKLDTYGYLYFFFIFFFFFFEKIYPLKYRYGILVGHWIEISTELTKATKCWFFAQHDIDINTNTNLRSENISTFSFNHDHICPQQKVDIKIFQLNASMVSHYEKEQTLSVNYNHPFLSSSSIKSLKYWVHVTWLPNQHSWKTIKRLLFIFHWEYEINPILI